MQYKNRYVSYFFNLQKISLDKVQKDNYQCARVEPLWKYALATNLMTRVVHSTIEKNGDEVLS